MAAAPTRRRPCNMESCKNKNWIEFRKALQLLWESPQSTPCNSNQNIIKTEVTEKFVNSSVDNVDTVLGTVGGPTASGNSEWIISHEPNNSGLLQVTVDTMADVVISGRKRTATHLAPSTANTSVGKRMKGCSNQGQGHTDIDNALGSKGSKRRKQHGKVEQHVDANPSDKTKRRKRKVARYQVFKKDNHAYNPKRTISALRSFVNTGEAEINRIFEADDCAIDKELKIEKFLERGYLLFHRAIKLPDQDESIECQIDFVKSKFENSISLLEKAINDWRRKSEEDKIQVNANASSSHSHSRRQSR